MKNIMKNNIRLILAAVALSVVFACQEKEPDNGSVIVIEPIFPELVTDYDVAPGEELEFTFTPNLDWELSLSEGSFQYFKLVEENGRQREKISGKASDTPITVKIQVNSLEELDNNRSCTLTLTMGGESQAVAEYMRPAKARVLSIYAAKVQDGAFVMDESGKYVYEEAEATEVEILWSDTDAAFMLPIKIEANCSWDIDRTSFPSWLELNVPNQTEGVVELVMKGISMQATSATVTFVAGPLSKQMNVSIESCSEIAVYSAKYEEGDWVYADAGYEYTETSQDNIALIWTGSDFRLPVLVDSKCEWSLEKPDWITAELDDVRAGQDQFILKCDPQYFPLDDTQVTLSFKYDGQVIKTMNLVVPGCREMITYALGMSLSTIEFNYSGQYKTTSGYMDAPLSGHVTAPSSMILRLVEIIEGKYVEEVPSWLNCELNVDSDTDTKLVLQTKALEISVTENLTQSQRNAYIFLLPRQVESLSELFAEDQCTVREEYARYVIPVTQAFLPADYLTPEYSAEEMDAEGATLTKTEKAELYECFGSTRYAYEMTYKNTWSGDVARMYLTYPYAAVEYYDEQKQLVTDKDNFWINFTDYMENKTFGAITIPTVRQTPQGTWVELAPEAGVDYVVFKDEAGATLCVVEFTYAPEIVIPEEPEIVDKDEIVDASQFFANKSAADAAGATLAEVLAIMVPEVTAESTQAEINMAEYKKNLTKTFKNCAPYDAPLYRLTYTDASTQLTLDFGDILKNKAVMFSVNPSEAADAVTVDGKLMNEDALLATSISSKNYHGKPVIKMPNFDDVPEEKLATTPVVVLFYDSEYSILLAIECVLAE